VSTIAKPAGRDTTILITHLSLGAERSVYFIVVRGISPLALRKKIGRHVRTAILGMSGMVRGQRVGIEEVKGALKLVAGPVRRIVRDMPQ
jgi:hypothetical protein